MVIANGFLLHQRFCWCDLDIRQDRRELNAAVYCMARCFPLLSRGCQTAEKHPKPGHPTLPLTHSGSFLPSDHQSAIQSKHISLYCLAWTRKFYMKTIKFVVGCWLRIPGCISHFTRGIKPGSALYKAVSALRPLAPPVALRGKHTDPPKIRRQTGLVTDLAQSHLTP